MSESYELVKFVDGSFELEGNVSPEEDTVWLTQQQMVLLFQTSRSSIVEHIRKFYSEKELDESSTCRIIRQVRIEGNRRMAVLFQKAKSTINCHINKAYDEGELSDGTMKKFENIDFSKKPANYCSRTVKDFFTVRIEGNRRMARSV